MIQSYNKEYVDSMMFQNHTLKVENRHLTTEVAESERQTRAQLDRVINRDIDIKRLRRALDHIKVRAYEIDE